MSSVDCWNYVDDAATTIFGKSITNEIKDDYAQEEEFIKTLRANNVYSTIVAAYEDYHQLRGELISVLKTSPEMIIDQATWSDHFVGRLQPFLVVAATAGEEGVPPEDYDRILGYVDSNVQVDKVPEARWWWAASPKFWPNVDGRENIALKNREAWLSIAGEFAPIAKLLLDGRTARTMLGPELLRAEANIVNVKVDPRFAYPLNEISLDYWRYLTGRDSYRCDLSYETVASDEGCIVDPWALRLKTGLLDELLGDMRLNYRRYLAFWRDWSPWLLSEEFREILQSYEDNPTPLTSFWKADVNS
jgi:hypothetical protein